MAAFRKWGQPMTTGGRVRLGIIANEVFSVDHGRMGGFGWAVQQVARCFGDDPDAGVDPVILVAERRDGLGPPQLHGVPVVWSEEPWLDRYRKISRPKIDLLLAIDFRSSYRKFLYAMPRVPTLIWARDPWSNADRARIATLRIPGQENREPAGVRGPDPGTIRQVLWQSRVCRRRLAFATTAAAIGDKMAEGYGIDPPAATILPNIVATAPEPVDKTGGPTVVFLGRLDPIKRPWIFTALAERFPEVNFLVLGQSHFAGPGSWQPNGLAPNVRLLGHVGEVEKARLLREASLLVNSSIHEGLSISFLESLAFQTPIVSSVDPDTVVSRFGIYVGEALGTGIEALPRFEAAIRELLTNRGQSRQLGIAGQAWVRAAHSRDAFLTAFWAIAAELGVRLSAGAR